MLKRVQKGARVVPGRLPHIALEVRKGRQLENSDEGRQTRRGRRRLSVATGVGWVVHRLPSMMCSRRPTPRHSRRRRGSWPSRQPRRRLQASGGARRSVISPGGRGARGRGLGAVQEDAEAAESLLPLSFPLSLSHFLLRLITALAACLNILRPQKTPLEMPQLLPGPAAQPRLPRAAPRLLRFSARGEFVERLD